jgi:hypothetical protein
MRLSVNAFLSPPYEANYCAMICGVVQLVLYLKRMCNGEFLITNLYPFHTSKINFMAMKNKRLTCINQVQRTWFCLFDWVQIHNEGNLR